MKDDKKDTIDKNNDGVCKAGNMSVGNGDDGVKNGEKMLSGASFWRILSFIIAFLAPPAGIALYFIWKNAHHERAYHAALGTLSGVIMYCIICIAFYAVKLVPFFA